jgi:hypothetical protein
MKLKIQFKNYKTGHFYNLITHADSGFWLDNDDEGMAISEQELFDLLDKHFKDNF